MPSQPKQDPAATHADSSSSADGNLAMALPARVEHAPPPAKSPIKAKVGAIKRIRSMKGVGILANKATKDAMPEFRRFNLVYGFNGSGKSTLSRIFASLQAGAMSELLPEGSAFEVEMQDGSNYPSEKLSGLEKTVCVFNADFIGEHLQWEKGVAKSIFYISKEQADVAEQLRAAEALLPLREEAKKSADKLLKEREKTFKTYCTERAKVVHGALQLGSRKFEAPQLKSDYENIPYDEKSLLDADNIKTLQGLVRLAAPPPPLAKVHLVSANLAIVEKARALAEASIGKVVLEELEKHPDMVPWIKQGHDYHAKKGLDTCLLCGSDFTSARKDQLAAALDDKIASLMTELQTAERYGTRASEELVAALRSCPKATELDLSLQADYEAAQAKFAEAAARAKQLLTKAAKAVSERLQKPTIPIPHQLPDAIEVQTTFDALSAALSDVNSVIDKHNKAGKDFNARQDAARLSLRKHFLSEGATDYTSRKKAVADGERDVSNLEVEVGDLTTKISSLRSKIRQHGPAAEKLTKLVRAYLGHGELTVIAANEGYELHRNGKLVKGAPSEGEKTAIALCYFLCTLESEGRNIKDLIVVIDDPISSLDTKAMNYACALVRSRLEGAAQVIVLTHNQHCMNEFKKAWKSRAYPRSKDTDPTATLLFLDVVLPAAQGTRTSSLVEMSALLREYDSEYHFLCHKVLEFEAAGTGHSEYGFMMPNVIRRVLDVFLAFKVPGTSNLSDKLQQLSRRHAELDPVRLSALERLSQVESHSDNLDDLIAHSSMTIEETRDANAALLHLMSVADKEHTAAVRTHCKPKKIAA
jgi:wobble nucleotide-excising tRNase